MASVAEEPYQRISHWIPPDTILRQQEDKNHKTTSSLRQQFLPVISMTPESDHDRLYSQAFQGCNIMKYCSVVGLHKAIQQHPNLRHFRNINMSSSQQSNPVASTSRASASQPHQQFSPSSAEGRSDIAITSRKTVPLHGQFTKARSGEGSKRQKDVVRLTEENRLLRGE